MDDGVVACTSMCSGGGRCGRGRCAGCGGGLSVLLAKLYCNVKVLHQPCRDNLSYYKYDIIMSTANAVDRNQ